MTEAGEMADPLARRSLATPDRTALVDAETGRTWRYHALDVDVGASADRLAGLGLAPGDHLGLLVETSARAVELVHAAWRLGLRVVPLHPSLPAPEAVDLAERADVDAVVCSPGTADVAAALPARVVGFGGGTDDRPGVDALEAVEPAAADPATWAPRDVAAMPTTSGTTGRPKLVELTMGNLLASATASAFRLGVARDDRWLLCLPVAHVGGLSPVLRSAHYGTTLVVVEGFDPAAVLWAAREHGVTGVSLVPTQLRRLLEAGDPLPESLDTVLLGGAPAPAELLERCRAFELPVYPTYGLTEAASQVATATPAQAAARPGTVGQPLVGIEVGVVDGSGEPVPAGERGEIVVGGPVVTPGYYGDPDATAEAFGPRGLHTGDVGRRDEDGFLWVLGRLDDVIVTGGENVQPRTVEAALRAHPSVEDAAVVGLPDEEWGERVVALVVPTAGEPPDPDALVDHCRGRLAGYQVPKGFAPADELPRTASGTVDRPAVRRRLAEWAA